jgi:cystathionine gamma-lyase
MHIDTLAIHAGQTPDPTTGAIMTPVYQTSTYVQQGPGEHKGFEYARTQNPTRFALEGNLAALEGAQYGMAFGSGLAASSTVLHLLQSGDHIVCSDDVYGGTYRLISRVFQQMGIACSYVDLTHPAKLQEAIQPNTKAVWLETPSNPLLKIIDIEAVAAYAHAKGLLCICDNTFATPVFQKPLQQGCDIVVHSTTKYLNGHSDVVGGFACTNDAGLAHKLSFLQNAIGAVPGPWDAWLVLRGTKTLPLRMRAHAANAAVLAEFLLAHPCVEKVFYPGLPSHPNHAVAVRQMTGFSGMISFVIKGGLPAARAFLTSLQVFALAESLGGVESLVEHPAIMTHASIPAHTRAQLGIDDGLIRLSVGVEHIQDLQDDLSHAFNRVVSLRV